MKKKKLMIWIMIIIFGLLLICSPANAMPLKYGPQYTLANFGRYQQTARARGWTEYSESPNFFVCYYRSSMDQGIANGTIGFSFAKCAHYCGGLEVRALTRGPYELNSSEAWSFNYLDYGCLGGTRYTYTQHEFKDWNGQE